MMQQCPNGHLYDDERTPNCPFCNDSSAVGATLPLGEETAPFQDSYSAPAPAAAAGGAFPQTIPLNGVSFVSPNPAVADDGEFPITTPVDSSMNVTVDLSGSSESGVKLVRGWLVCTDGAGRGRDFKIAGERNTIGRGDTNDIKLDFDDTISRTVNATISYDNKNNKFYITPNPESKHNIYINGNLLLMPVELKDYDVIEIGKSKLILRTLCNDAFNWGL